MFTESQKPNTHIKDQSLSIEVEEWLKHNKPIVLERGQSTARAGYKCTVNPSSMIISEEESRRRIEEQNKIVRERRQRSKNKTHVSNELFEDLMYHIYSQCGYGDIKAIADLAGINESMISNCKKKGYMTNQMYEKVKPIADNFVFNCNTPKKREKKEKIKPQKPISRLRMLVILKNEALSKGLTNFTAECKNHGETEFTIVHGSARCVKCAEIASKRRNKSNYDKDLQAKMARTSKNRENMEAALAKGEIYFNGECQHHGFTRFKSVKNKKNKSGYSCRCLECLVVAIAKRDEKLRLQNLPK